MYAEEEETLLVASRKKTTAKSTVPLIPQPHGGALKAGGTPGNKGGTGRPPNKFIETCLKNTEDPSLWAAAKEKHPLGVLQMSAEYAHGKPKDTLSVEGEITVRVEYDAP